MGEFSKVSIILVKKVQLKIVAKWYKILKKRLTGQGLGDIILKEYPIKLIGIKKQDKWCVVTVRSFEPPV